MAEKEYIERDALLKKLNSDLARWVDSAAEYKEDKSGMHAMKEAILYVIAAPAADVVEVRHGHWEFVSLDGGLWCSECKIQSLHKGYATNNYCPNCGAKMDGGKTE